MVVIMKKSRKQKIYYQTRKIALKTANPRLCIRIKRIIPLFQKQKA